MVNRKHKEHKNSPILYGSCYSNDHCVVHPIKEGGTTYNMYA